VCRTARDLALERALRYLERCGVPTSAEMRGELEELVAHLPAAGDDVRSLDRVMDHLWSRLEQCRGQVPPVFPPIHRASMGHG
jgi:hypothetical protein